MPSDAQQITNLEAELDALVSPTTAEVRALSRDYDADIVAASAARMALAGGGGGGSQPVELATAHVTSAEILALNTTSKEIVAAPGAGKMILPFAGFVQYTFGGTPYTTEHDNDKLLLTTPDLQGFGLAILETAGGTFIKQSASRIAAWLGNALADLSTNGEFSPPSWVDNKPLVLWYGFGVDPTLGNGTLDLAVHYVVMDLP